MTGAAGVERVEVLVIGGGLAGAAVAARLAGAGREVVLLERSPSWRWRAGGVFASPAAVRKLRRAGLDEATIRQVARPIPALRVESPGGSTVRLTYGAERRAWGDHETAVGFDRSRLDPAMLNLARDRGAEVRAGVAAVGVDLPAGRVRARDDAGAETTIDANLIVGADGIRSLVARAAGVARPVRLARRVGLTYHLADPDGPPAREGRMRIIRDGYVGIAPVPGGRVNVGLVLGPSWHARLRETGADAVASAIVDAVPPTDDDPGGWRTGARCDRIEGAWPLGHRVTRRTGSGDRSGRGWLLVGDAAGFLDPFTGEGLHRALVSAELAATTIADGRPQPDALAAYERSMRRRFAAKDVVSMIVQAFLSRPAAFEYAARRLASRSSVRTTMGLVMGDLVPASRGLDPRFLAALLAP